jgi:hypothetical protein
MHLDLLTELLKKYDEVTILELLDISTEELLIMFKERVIAKRRFLEQELEALPEPPEAGEGGTFYDDEDLFDEELEDNI